MDNKEKYFWERIELIFICITFYYLIGYIIGTVENKTYNIYTWDNYFFMMYYFGGGILLFLLMLYKSIRGYKNK